LAASFAFADPPPTYTHNITLAGTVGSGTISVTVNGTAATLNGTNFSASVILKFGTNVLQVVATDTAGNAQQQMLTLYLDLPSGQSANCCTVTISGTVNDAGSTTTVNGGIATVANGIFSRDVALNYGSNTIAAQSTDAAGNQATHSIVLFVTTSSAAPVISSTTPSAPLLVLSRHAQPIAITATDADGDYLFYRATLDPQQAGGWGGASSFTWTPQEQDFGAGTLQLEVMDTTGATDSSSVGVFVAHEPLSP
jgi:hypothetical protein